VKPTQFHIPTGKLCRVVSEHAGGMVLQLDMGDYPNPFPRVDACDVKPIGSDEAILAQAKALDEAYASATGPAEAFDKDLVALVRAARTLHNACKRDGIRITENDALGEALEQFEPWLEEDNDPRSMGWVNDKGLP
jgi:hypothetical protein